MRQAVPLLLTVVFLTVAWMSFDNVWTDVAPTQALAEAAACRAKDCKHPHGVTRVSRWPTGQTFDITWQDGVVTVTCHRESYVLGPMQCQVP